MKVVLLINSILWCFLFTYFFYCFGVAVLALSVAGLGKLLAAALLLAIATMSQMVFGIAAH